jgi:hypothetical protein
VGQCGGRGGSGFRGGLAAEVAKQTFKESRMEKLVSKLGTARQVPRSRIWIEGKRLVEAGFTVGKYFYKEMGMRTDTDDLQARLVLTLAADGDVTNVMPSKVSGKGAKPIIDITGACVRDNFGFMFSHVEVTFEPGMIVIVGVNP